MHHDAPREDSDRRSAFRPSPLPGVFALALVVGSLLLGCATPRREPGVGFYHVGLVWLKEPDNQEHRRRLVEAAQSFVREIPEVRRLSVGPPPPSTSPYVDASFDVCFVMELRDRAALERYGRHPVHERAAREVFLPLSEKILFYDFEGQ